MLVYMNYKVLLLFETSHIKHVRTLTSELILHYHPFRIYRFIHSFTIEHAKVIGCSKNCARYLYTCARSNIRFSRLFEGELSKQRRLQRNGLLRLVLKSRTRRQRQDEPLRVARNVVLYPSLPVEVPFLSHPIIILLLLS